MRLPVPGDPQKLDIVSLTAEELSEELSDLKLPKFRISQIKKGVLAGRDICGLTNLPLSLREELSSRFGVPKVSIASKQVSSDGTEKYLFALGDGSFVEGVFMRYNHGNTLCISTQVGCRMGCAFCASGLDGLLRGLNPSEMLGEIGAAQKETGERVDGIVMMGTGEPLDNYEASLTFIKTVSSPDSFNIGQRHISLSTSGLVPKIKMLEAEKLGITLSVSLHAPFDDMRTRLMPVNKSWNVKELIDAATAYQRATGRRVSYEYAMISGLNDTPECARELVRLLSGKEAHINLIRLNEIAESPFHPSTQADLSKFTEILEKGHVNVTLRRRLGKDIDGACGQLRRRAKPNC